MEALTIATLMIYRISLQIRNIRAECVRKRTYAPVKRYVRNRIFLREKNQFIEYTHGGKKLKNLKVDMMRQREEKTSRKFFLTVRRYIGYIC